MFSLSFSLFIVQLNINILLMRLSGQNLSKGAWSALAQYPHLFARFANPISLFYD